MTAANWAQGARIRAVGLGQGLFAIGSASLAVWILAYGRLSPQPLPAGMPGRDVWVYGAALIVLAASAGLYFSRAALLSALTIGAYLTVSVALSVPELFSKPLSIGAWYPCCEALTALSGAWILYRLLRSRPRGSGAQAAGEPAMRAARIVFGLTCVFYGWSHFVYAAYTASMVPGWLPGRLPLAYFTGACHVAAGLAIIVGIVPRLAATLEAVMMSMFGLLVWVPSFFAQPRPSWAKPPEQQWSELVVTLVLAVSAWVVAISLGNRSWAFASRARVRIDVA